MQSKLECPIEGVKIDETRVRLVALFVVVFAVIILLTSNPILAVILVFDFALRSLNLTTYSPFALIAGWLAKWFKLKNRPVDRGPKRFAALMGTIFSTLIITLIIFGFTFEAKIITVILLLFASLESFFGFCAGCYVYTSINTFKKDYNE